MTLSLVLVVLALVLFVLAGVGVGHPRLNLVALGLAALTLAALLRDHGAVFAAAPLGKYWA